SATKQWAGRFLASIGESLRKYDAKLEEVNPAYRDEKAKLKGKSLTAVLFPQHVGNVVQRELKRAQSYRKRLLLLKRLFPNAWEKAARKEKIPQVSFALSNLPEFSLKSEPQWWKVLWPSISKKINVRKLDSRYPMHRKRYSVDSESAARDHL